MGTVRNKFGTLQEISKKYTSNSKYENFVTAYIKAAAECIPTNPRAKYKVPYVSIAVREEQNSKKKTSLLYKKTTNANAQKLKKA